MLLFLSMLETEEEQDLFTQLYEKYRYLLWYVAKDILKDANLAEDAVQEAYLTLAKYLTKIEDVNSPRTKRFLVTIVKSRAIDMLRREKRVEFSEYEQAVTEECVEEDGLNTFLRRESMQELAAAIRSLDQKYRVVLELRYLHELSEKETAQILEIPEKTVNVRAYRARARLQQLLGQNNGIRGGRNHES